MLWTRVRFPPPPPEALCTWRDVVTANVAGTGIDAGDGESRTAGLPVKVFLMGATWLRHGTPTRQAAREMTNVIGIKATNANDESYGMKKAA